MSLAYEMMKMAAHELLKQGRIYCKEINNQGEPVYVSAENATKQDKEFSAKFLAALDKGLVDADGNGIVIA